MYDNTCKFLAENFSADFASWLLGETVTLTAIQPSELSLDPIRADAMILLQSENSILHLEFQTIPKENIPFRMLDYRVRGDRKYKGKPMRQVVFYLKPTTSELAYQTSYDLERTHHEFDVIRLWEEPADRFLQYPGLLPLATLGQSDSPTEMLRQVTQMIDQIEEPTKQSNLMAASAILAALRLEDDVIYRIVRRDIMQESSIYRSIQDDEKRSIALNFLRDGFPAEAVARGTGLSIEQVQQLQQQISTVPQS
ncbi:MAG: Rpn family recombination-promoting nuclease/putative transposase [Alkalinema sp. RU_4_3]|nr:Rpn family recombination-promoting nuclease/putative transposase [Alkalinema sp. RU_4_3]